MIVIRRRRFNDYEYPEVRFFCDAGNGETLIVQARQEAREFPPTHASPSGYQAPIPGGLLVLSPSQTLLFLEALQGESPSLDAWIRQPEKLPELFRNTRWRKAG